MVSFVAFRNRSWCPSLPSFSNAAVVALEPLNRAVHSEVPLTSNTHHQKANILNPQLGGGFKDVLFSPLFGEDFHID